MPDTHIPTQYRLDRVFIYYNHDGSIAYVDIMVETFNSINRHLTHEHLKDMVLPVGLLNSIKANVEARLLQLETETGWTKWQQP